MVTSPSLLPISEAAITLLNVDISYDGHAVLTNINQQFRPREFVVIEGEDGAGKSSLLRVIAGVQAPSRGSVLIGAHPLDDVGHSNYQQQVAWIPSRPDQVAMLDEATQANVPVLVIDEPEQGSECAMTYGILRLLGKRTIICATGAQDLIVEADYCITL